jgi:UDP-N-acetylglucosamine:LPS N-acetylglucosamine transferase
VFEREGALVLLREADCTPGRLKQEVLELIHSREKRNRFSERLSRLAKPDAAESLVEVCLQ